MAIFERGDVSIYYEDSGSGFPLLMLAPGGMNSTVDFWGRMPLNPVAIFPSEFRIVAMDQRNAGRSRAPLPLVDPWGAYAADQLGLLDHLGIEQFMAIGCCIGSSFILKLAEVAPSRLVAGVLMQPIGLDDTNPGFFDPRIYAEWGENLASKRPDIKPEDVKTFGTTMWSGDFVLSEPREFVRTVTTPMLVMPGNDMAHPRGVGLEVAELLPNAELVEDWREPPEVVPQAVERMRSFLHAHAPSMETAP